MLESRRQREEWDGGGQDSSDHSRNVMDSRTGIAEEWTMTSPKAALALLFLFLRGTPLLPAMVMNMSCQSKVYAVIMTCDPAYLLTTYLLTYWLTTLHPVHVLTDLSPDHICLFMVYLVPL